MKISLRRQAAARVIQSGFIVGLWLALLALLIHPARASVTFTTFTVCASGCTHTTIQSAINAASPNDVIKVAVGTYTEHIVIAESISLIGGWTNPPTLTVRTLGASILDGSNTDRALIITATTPITPLVDGFTIQHGTAANSSVDSGVGSGIYINLAQATLQNNWIISNSSDVEGSRGGGIGILGADVIISNNVIAGNVLTANLPDTVGGAGIYAQNGSPYIYSNTIQFNTAYGNGAGILVNDFLPASPIIQRNLLQYNKSITESTLSNGGGLLVQSFGGLPVIDSNRLYSNTSDNGVLGIYAIDQYQVTNNILLHNHGGGIHLYGTGPGVIANNLILYTQGIYGAMRLTDQAGVMYVFNNMIMSNSYGLEVEVGANPLRGYNLVFHNVLSNYVSISGSLSSNLSAAAGDLNTDPLFVDVKAGDYHLKNGSPAINAGVYYPGAPAFDYAGNPRPFSRADYQDCRFDIGIYERIDLPFPCRRVYLPVVNKQH
jgi:hypothetical protein